MQITKNELYYLGSMDLEETLLLVFTETYLEKSSCKVSGISSLGFPRVELNFSFSLSTNSLNSFAQTLQKKREKCYQPQFLRMGKDPLLSKHSWNILVEVAGFELSCQKLYNRRVNASKKLCGGHVS